MNRCLLMVVMSSAWAGLNAQEIGLSIGYGTYDMSELKFLITDALVNNQTAKTVEDFPSSVTFGVHFSVPLGKRFEIGASGLLSTTNSRVSFSENGAHYFWDHKLNGVSAALVPMFLLLRREKSAFFLETKTGFTISYLNVSGEQRSPQPSASWGPQEYNSLNYFIEPAFRFRHQIGSSRLAVALRGGYQFTFAKGKLFYKREPDAHLQTSVGSTHASWSGFRADILFLYSLGRE